MRERRPGVWQLRVALGVDSDGKYRTVHRTVTGGKRAAQAALTDLLVEARRLRAMPDRGPANLGELIDAWLDHVEADRSPTTIRGYKTSRARIPQRVLELPLDQLGTVDLDAVYRALRARKLAPSTIRQTHAVMSGALAQGVAWGHLTANVATAASPPSVRKREPTVPTAGEVAALMVAAARIEPELVPFLRVAAATGMRRGELVGMQWGDLSDGVLHVRRNLVIADREVVSKAPKSWQARRVPLDAGTLAALEVVPRSGPWVWSVDGERPWHPDTATARFERVREYAGLERVRLHDLRHFCATELLAAGEDPATVAARLGHQSVTTTWAIYAHAIPARGQGAADTIGRVLDGG